ncbi:TIGR02444 family protein [Brevundimonas sp.]|uniref:TIGR02444 family protein n=1 Tax=Brevundimonas sp. TaxID=1871086 RepID=UPI002FCB44D1
MSSGLWDWALAAYKREGVPEACLALQDFHEQNVCLLLWGAWCAETGRLPDEETLEAAADTTRAWETTTVAPLRAIRRTLKAPVPDLDIEARLSVREQIKALELKAERHLLNQLEELAPAPSGKTRPALDGMADAARLWTRIIPRPALKTLAERLSA